MINGLNHLTLGVKDMRRSFDFYKEIMGFQPLCRWNEGAYFRAADLWLCLTLDPELTPAKGYTHYAFSISSEDFPVFYESIEDNHITHWKTNQSEGDSLYILDPDGHQLEIHVGDVWSRLKEKKQNPWPNAEFFI